MKPFDKILITEISDPVFVFSEKGRVFEMKNRKHFGISFCESGQITYVMNGKKFVSDRQHAVLLPMGGNYQLIGDAKGVFPVINFQCSNFETDEISVFPLLNPDLCLKLCRKMQNIAMNEKNRFLMFSVFYELLSQVFVKEEPKNPLMPVKSFIEKNLSDPNLTNSVLAEKIGFSEVYLRKLFDKYYRTSPRQYVLELRLRKAKQMLSDTSFPVTEIAESCGFSSVYHFCRIFKEKVGVTPSRFADLSRIHEI